MLNFKKLASTFIFSVLAFQSTAFAVTRYAKVVLLGGKGSGKTTIQKLINKDYNIDNIPHTTQISYISVPVFYDNKGNFTFDEEEDRDVQRYNKEVILNICDTPAGDNQGVEEGTKEYEDNEDIFRCVKEFTKKKPTVVVNLASCEDFKLDGMSLIANDFFNGRIEAMFSGLSPARKIIIFTDPSSRSGGFLGILSNYYERLFNLCEGDEHVDTSKALIIYDEKNLEEKKKFEKCGKENNKIKNKFEGNSINNKNNISKIDLEYTSKTEELFNKNREEDLKKYSDTILSAIARSVYKYGISNLDFDSNASDWNIIDGKLVKGQN